MKTIVNIISREHPLAAYLFVKEYFEPGDKLLFIASHENFECITPLVNCLKIDKEQVQRIVLRRDEDMYTYERICRTIQENVAKEGEYYVNLAGGTRYMALSVQHVFSNFNAQFFYVQTHENLIVKTIFDNSILDNDDEIFPIKHKMSLGEYLEVHGLSHDLDQQQPPVGDEAQLQYMFYLFANRKLRSSDYKILDTLRESYRGWKYLNIKEVEHPVNDKMVPIRTLSRFLDFLHFVPKEKGVLQREELEFLTGGWFEEYVYYLIKKNVAPDEIAIGVHIDGCTDIKHNNELDVSFIKNNQFFVIECKSGINSESMFNEIVYKVCALKEVLLGLDCHSYIFSLKRDEKGDLKRIAQYMDIRFCDYDCMTRDDKMQKQLKEMLKLAR